ncbi:MAG: hypothetical protein ACRCYA_06670 [Cetobacterium sp.]|uniref:hypothetical protein n=1 Tax=Cetobacterium sp. TaxID=2071632 RepID=UPI003F348520
MFLSQPLPYPKPLPPPAEEIGTSPDLSGFIDRIRFSANATGEMGNVFYSPAPSLI